MNFAPDLAAQAFRAEVRAFLREHLPADMAARTLRGYHARKPDMIAWTRILHAHGWSAPHWPREHGGPGWTPLQRHLPREEMIAMGWMDEAGVVREGFKTPAQGASTSVWVTSPKRRAPLVCFSGQSSPCKRLRRSQVALVCSPSLDRISDRA